MVEIWLTEPYYRDYRYRKGTLFQEDEKVEIFALTQELQKKWPGCAVSPPPELGRSSGLYYVKCRLQSAHLRIAFGFDDNYQKTDSP